ncbi:MurR/RpiR family transcriptional regulator [Pseudoclavibacter terrae]|uniref:MurR/RpiR family transcriptional regulator n=1 Tax=Pseudoclavibacter terrae TaxID=1530195 RepID=UPI00142EC2CA|nr:MurR/RpiR family transcriptional regulator [Pseudoclavibacter terrae]
MTEDQREDIGAWVQSLVSSTALTPKAQEVLRALEVNPRLASYGSVRAVAEKAGVSIGTVSRTAQSLGYLGWPALQQELRARYLSSLSATGLAAQRQSGQEQPMLASITRDQVNLASVLHSIGMEQITRTARRLAASRRIIVLARGSYAGVGMIFAHGCSLNGYDARLIMDEAQVPNTLATLTSEDLVVVISFWRLYESAYRAIQACDARGIPIVLLTETVTREIEEQCSECIKVPTEGIGFSPSLTSATAVVHGLIAELVAVDPSRATTAIEQAELEWDRFDLFRRF